jgi:transcriptional regulator of aromatic amino acid metabolism
VPENLPSFIYESTRVPGEINITQSSSLHNAIEEAEKQILLNAQKKYKTTREIARVLGISQPSVVRKLARHGLSEKKL